MTETARQEVLERIRQALGDPGSQTGVGDGLRSWQHAPPVHARPAISTADFVSRVEASGATWEKLPDESGLRDAVLGYCRAHSVGQLVPGDEAFGPLGWPAGLIHKGRPAASGSAVLCRASLGVAETGSLLLLADSHAVAALQVLPEHLLVVLQVSRVVTHLEEGVAGELPWSANLVTGPSRTGDVEQTIALGAHGPRRVHLFLAGAR